MSRRKQMLVLVSVVVMLLLTIVFPTKATAELIHEWKFENNLNDTSGSGNHGTATGTPTYASGRSGQAYVRRCG